MAQQLARRGFYSVLRWARDRTRDEAKNVAVILVDEEGQFGGVRAAPLSSISSNIREQGILDAMIVGLGNQFVAKPKPDLAKLNAMCETMERSIYFTEPRPVAVFDEVEALTALYKAYVSPRGAPRGAVTKGAVLDTVMDQLRRKGVAAKRGEYIGDFLFDIVVGDGQQRVLEVLSFATAAQDWMPTENDAAHFLYGLERVKCPAHGVVKPPSEASHPNARVAHDRVLRWFEEAHVQVVEPSHVGEIPFAVV